MNVQFSLNVALKGYPLWEPECKVSIGDVGYIRDGRFYRLFNALLPPGDSQNNFGEPKGFQPLQLDEHAMMESTLSPGPMYSRSITNHGADVGALGLGLFFFLFFPVTYRLQSFVKGPSFKQDWSVIQLSLIILLMIFIADHRALNFRVERIKVQF